MTTNEIWQAILAEFELKLSKANFITWFSNTGISKYENGHFEICVPNMFTKSWLEKKYHSEIIKLLEKVIQRPVKKVDYTVDSVKNLQEKNCEFNQQKPAEDKKITNEPRPTQSPTMQFNTWQPSSNQLSLNSNSINLNPKYTFSSFIVGKNNELAHAAAQAVANKPGEAYNPLFIYGGVGLGKTHLLQAIAHSMIAKNPNTQVLYVTSEKFTNEFISAVQQKRINNFKEKYRNVDLLLIDDIQFIGGKEQTQEEFFHTFNELHQQRKQVVLTSDRPPKAITSLEDRLRSRFEWGMIADVSAPDLETRVAILKTKGVEKNFNLPEELFQMIASTVQSNIRELEGALNKVIAYHQLKNLNPTTESVKSIISPFENSISKVNLGVKDVINLVSEHFNLSPQDILEKKRSRHISVPRQIIMYLLRVDFNLSYPAIGNELGGRDHTTAMHAHNKIESEMKENTKIKQDIEAIKQKLYSASF